MKAITGTYFVNLDVVGHLELRPDRFYPTEGWQPVRSRGLAAPSGEEQASPSGKEGDATEGGDCAKNADAGKDE